MTTRVALNGFGRVGRAVLRATYDRRLDLCIVAVNDLFDGDTMARLLARDSVFGRFRGEIKTTGTELLVDGELIQLFAEKASSCRTARAQRTAWFR